MLAWPDPTEPTGTRFQLHVDHPGIRPRLIYRGIRKSFMQYAANVLGTTMEKTFLTDAEMDAIQELRNAMQERIMPAAVSLMGVALKDAAPGVRAIEDGGKLGISASDAWEAEAKVTETD